MMPLPLPKSRPNGMHPRKTVTFRGRVYYRYVIARSPDLAKAIIRKLRKSELPAQIGRDGVTVYVLRDRPPAYRPAPRKRTAPILLNNMKSFLWD